MLERAAVPIPHQVVDQPFGPRRVLSDLLKGLLPRGRHPSRPEHVGVGSAVLDQLHGHVVEKTCLCLITRQLTSPHPLFAPFGALPTDESGGFQPARACGGDARACAAVAWRSAFRPPVTQGFPRPSPQTRSGPHAGLRPPGGKDSAMAARGARGHRSPVRPIKPYQHPRNRVPEFRSPHDRWPERGTGPSSRRPSRGPCPPAAVRRRGKAVYSRYTRRALPEPIMWATRAASGGSTRRRPAAAPAPWPGSAGSTARPGDSSRPRRGRRSRTAACGRGQAPAALP